MAAITLSMVGIVLLPAISKAANDGEIDTARTYIHWDCGALRSWSNRPTVRDLPLSLCPGQPGNINCAAHGPVTALARTQQGIST